jgi:hypothetical protein|eukprot:scaffold2181_cov214-Alexandrium_tamarense.AAC.7
MQRIIIPSSDIKFTFSSKVQIKISIPLDSNPMGIGWVINKGGVSIESYSQVDLALTSTLDSKEAMKLDGVVKTEIDDLRSR